MFICRTKLIMNAFLTNHILVLKDFYSFFILHCIEKEDITCLPSQNHFVNPALRTESFHSTLKVEVSSSHCSHVVPFS